MRRKAKSIGDWITNMQDGIIMPKNEIKEEKSHTKRNCYSDFQTIFFIAVISQG